VKTLLLSAACSAVLAGCGPQVNSPLVTYVPTHTPGLKYVVVSHPGMHDEYGSHNRFSKTSQYILLCDGRPVDGMHCAIPPEVGQHESAGPTVLRAREPVPEMVGALVGKETEERAAAPPPADGAVPVVAPVIVAPPAPVVPVRPAPKVGK
jgi:hypothetical protein